METFCPRHAGGNVGETGAGPGWDLWLENWPPRCSALAKARFSGTCLLLFLVTGHVLLDSLILSKISQPHFSQAIGRRLR